MGTVILAALLPYLISLAAGLRGEAISEKRRKGLAKVLEDKSQQLFAIQSRRSLKEQLALVGSSVGQIMGELETDPVEERVFNLLGDALFQENLAEWLMTWDNEEARSSRERIEEAIAEALLNGGADDEKIEWFRAEFFDVVENVVFADEKLSLWRMHLGIAALFEQHSTIIDGQNEILARLTPEEQQTAFNSYRYRLLKDHDLSDLMQLPAGQREAIMRGVIEEIKTVPYAPLSHPFVERLIGSIRSEFLDHTLFWNALDLERKLADFQSYFNEYRVHSSLLGKTPTEVSKGSITRCADLACFRWETHCRGLYQLPMAA